MDYGVINSGGNSSEIKFKKIIYEANNIPLNKDVNLFITPAVSLNDNAKNIYAEIKTKGVLKFDNVVISNSSSYEVNALPIGTRFTFNVSNGSVVAAITGLEHQNVYIFECE